MFMDSIAKLKQFMINEIVIMNNNFGRDKELDFFF